MDDKTNLYVFEKKEVLLIFIFMILIAITSFVLGVKVGKSFTYSNVEQALEESKSIQILSPEEEKVEELMKAQPSQDQKDHSEILEENLKQELENRNREETQTAPLGSDIGSDIDPLFMEDQPEVETSAAPLEGKHTIQVGAHRSKAEAEQFANGFIARGYDTYIKEVELSGRGIWYRVSIGAFDSLTQAKEYVQKEQSLFQKEDYIFQRL